MAMIVFKDNIEGNTRSVLRWEEKLQMPTMGGNSVF